MSSSNSEVQKKLIRRLSIVEGQIRGIKTIIEENNCEKAAQQMLAARRALDKAFSEMLSCMVEEKLASGTTEDVAEIKHIISKYMN